MIIAFFSLFKSLICCAIAVGIIYGSVEFAFNFYKFYPEVPQWYKNLLCGTAIAIAIIIFLIGVI